MLVYTYHLNPSKSSIFTISCIIGPSLSLGKYMYPCILYMYTGCAGGLLGSTGVYGHNNSGSGFGTCISGKLSQSIIGIIGSISSGV